MIEVGKYFEKEPFRGRPRNHRSYSTISILNSISQIAAKYNSDSGELLDALVKAWVYKDATCGRLEVKCRKADNDAAILLITCNDNVVCQFLVDVEILRNPEFYKSSLPTVSSEIQKPISVDKNIEDLKTSMKAINLAARIVEIPTKHLVNTRYGWDAYVSNVLLADKTGTIRLSLWNKQIDEFSVGDSVKIEKANVTMYYGEPQVRIARGGTITLDSRTES